ncbi:MAG: heavy metal transport/detoxification protein [Chitinophagaceae bacterium]|nr:MAG: heavy metal transport/detoxification protein [Chitinophagaceae bacterium]
MEALKFKTNIKCTGCLAKVTPALNETVGEDNWEVDLQDPNKTLTVVADASENEVVAAIKEAGFEAEKV